MSAQSLEVVLRHAYFHRYTCEQWAGPTKECFQQAERDLETPLCALLLRLLFAPERATDPLLEAYFAFATTGRPDIGPHPTGTSCMNDTLVSSNTMLGCLLDCEESTMSRNVHQWSFLLRLLPTLLTLVPETSEQDKTWLQTQSKVVILLAHIIAVGLYPERYANPIRPKLQPTLMPAPSFQYGNTQGMESSQLSTHTAANVNSFPGYDPDATLEMDVFGGAVEEEENEDRAGTAKEKVGGKMEIANASLAAKILIDLVEKKDFKRLFEEWNAAKQQAGLPTDEEPWSTCKKIIIQSKHTPTPLAAEHPAIQKVLSMIPRLADHEFERKLIIHVKYRELEDEGTARAMPSAGLMGLIYHTIQIRPSLRDEVIIDHLLKLQQIKGSFDESFYLELWLTSLTGLREASLRASCPSTSQDQTTDSVCSSSVTTNRLLWRNLVLVKLPLLITKLQERKRNKHARSDVLAHAEGDEDDEDDELHPLEASLVQLKAFAGLLNACSPPLSNTDLIVPSSRSTDASNPYGYPSNDDDDIMNMINDTSYSMDPTPSATAPKMDTTKAIQTASSQDIYSSIVLSCERAGLVRKHIAVKHLTRSGPKKEEPVEPLEDKDEFDALLDTDMLHGDDNASNHMQVDTLDHAGIMDQIISQHMSVIRNTGSQAAIDELLHLGLVSLVHLRAIIDFFLELLREKATQRDVYTLARLCEAFSVYPATSALMLQYYEPALLLGPLEAFCNEWSPQDNETALDITDPDDDDMDGVQLLYSRFGKIWMFVMVTVRQCQLQRDLGSVFQNKSGFCYQFFLKGSVVYGADEHSSDYEVDTLVTRWLSAMGGSDGLSDDLLRSTGPQSLLRAMPTLMDRLLQMYGSGRMEKDTFVGILSYFEAKFLRFVLVPGVVEVLCDELLCRNTNAAMDSLCQLFLNSSTSPTDAVVHLCGYHILGSLETLAEQKRQQMCMENGASDTTAEQRKQLHNHLTAQLNGNVNAQPPRLEETVTTRVTPSTLSEKVQTMFRFIVTSGRSKFMVDVDGDPTGLWDKQHAPKETVSHFLDMALFETSLEMNGMRWFVTMIVDQVLEAGKSGGAVRAAELGSCLIATSLVYPSHSHHGCLNLLRCLLQDVLPLSLSRCAQLQASFFQGQTLGVFVANCLVLLHGGIEDQHGAIRALGRQFFDTLTVHKDRPAPPPTFLHAPMALPDAGLFSSWSAGVLASPVWRGFIKGLGSNPLIQDFWPHPSPSST